MTAFLVTDRGDLVNPRFVRRITSGEEYAATAHCDDGETYRLLANCLPRTVIPAIEPMVLLRVYFPRSLTEPVIDRLPIVAWSVDNSDDPKPIAVGVNPPSLDDWYFIELPSGRYQDMESPARYDSLDEAVEFVRDLYGDRRNP